MLCIEYSWHSRTVFGWRKQTQKPKFEVNDSSGGGRNSFHVQQNRSGTRPIFPPALNDNSNFRGADYAVICLRPPPCCRVSSSPRFFVLCQQRRDLPLRSSLSRHRRRNSKRTTTIEPSISCRHRGLERLGAVLLRSERPLFHPNNLFAHRSRVWFSTKLS